MAEFEKRHGIRIPASLRAELLRINGGKFTKGNFKKDGTIYGRYILVGFMGIRTDGKGRGGFCPMNEVCDEQDADLEKIAGSLDKIFMFECETVRCTPFAGQKKV